MHPNSRTATDTVVMPALRLYPPTQPDRRTWRLSRRGRIVRDMVAGAAVLGAALLVDPAVHAVVQLSVTVGQIVGAL